MAKLQGVPNPPNQKEMTQARRCLDQLAAMKRARSRSRFQVSDAQSSSGALDLPEPAMDLLAQILDQLSRGNAVALMPIHVEMTTQEAAAYLQVSRPFLIGLLERGEIPHRKVGRHRRVRAEDLLAFKERTTRDRLKILRRLVEDAQDQEAGY